MAEPLKSNRALRSTRVICARAYAQDRFRCALSGSSDRVLEDDRPLDEGVNSPLTAILRAVDVVTEVTPHGVRDGEPDALAELCTLRGAAVLAFIEHVVPGGQAAPAAADAFALFRVKVTKPADGAPQLDGIGADALLLSTTRSVALACRARAVRRDDEHDEERPQECVRFDALLARWMEDELPAIECERVERHVAECGDCTATLERLEAAERAYQSPPKAPLPPDAARAIVGALAAAAPVTALGGDVTAVREAAERSVLRDNAPPAANPSAATAAEPRAAASAGEPPATTAAASGSARRVWVTRRDRRTGPRLRSRALRERRREPRRPADHPPARERPGDAAPLPVVAYVTGGIVFASWVAGFGQAATGGVSTGTAILAVVLGIAVGVAVMRWVNDDATQRIRDRRLVHASTAVAALPIVGLVLYMILRPPEALGEAREREISIASSHKLIEVLVELQRTQLAIHSGVKHLEHALQRARSVAPQAAQPPSAAGRQS